MNKLTAAEYNKISLNKAFRHVKDTYTREKHIINSSRQAFK